MKITTFNVGKFTDGVRNGLAPEELPGRIDGWKRFLDDTDPDILVCLEASVYIDAAGTLPAYETLFKEKYPFYARPDSGSSLTKSILVCSKTPVSELCVRSFSSGSGRPFVSFVAVCGETSLRIAAVHLSIEAYSSGVRQADLAELSSMLRNSEFDVVLGDFNTFSVDEFDVFRPHCGMANHGIAGDFETWPHTAGGWSRCIDNIIAGEAVSIEKVTLGQEVLSDHMPLTAEIIHGGIDMRKKE